MLIKNGLPVEEGEETAGPGVLGFSKRLSQIASPAVEEPPAPKINITQEELDEGQKMKPLSLSETSMKDSVVQRTLNAMKAKHQQ